MDNLCCFLVCTDGEKQVLHTSQIISDHFSSTDSCNSSHGTFKLLALLLGPSEHKITLIQADQYDYNQ